MEHSYLAVAAVVACVYAIAKFVEVKYITKDEDFPLKLIIRDALVVYSSTCLSLFIMDQVSDKVISAPSTTAFTGSPDF
jgi:hypothetical protein